MRGKMDPGQLALKCLENRIVSWLCNAWKHGSWTVGFEGFEKLNPGQLALLAWKTGSLLAGFEGFEKLDPSQLVLEAWKT